LLFGGVLTLDECVAGSGDVEFDENGMPLPPDLSALFPPGMEDLFGGDGEESDDDDEEDDEEDEEGDEEEEEDAESSAP
jgi:hypothetical protein